MAALTAPTVTRDEVWLCYYTEFPLVQLRGGRVARHWSAPVAGSNAFAIGSGHCLFQGGYHKRNVYALAALESSVEPRIVRQFTLVDDAGNALVPSRMTARGDAIYLVVGTALYRLDIAASFDACSSPAAVR